MRTGAYAISWRRIVSVVIAVSLCAGAWASSPPESGQPERAGAATAPLPPYVWDEFWFGDRWVNFVSDTAGVAIDGDGYVYVSSEYHSRMAKYAPDGSRVLSWGKRGKDPGQFTFPRDVAVDALDNVYVADRGNDRVQKFSPSGKLLLVVGKTGRGDGELMGPRGVAVGPGGEIYISDNADGGRVQIFSAGGAFLKRIGGPGSAAGEFKLPSGMSTDATGNLYVADTLNHRIQVFGPAGDLIAHFGTKGTAPGMFESPGDVAPGPRRTIFVADSGNRDIQWLDSVGGFKAAFGPPAETGGYTSTNAASLAYGRDGAVYVANTNSDRVDRFTPLGAPVVLMTPVLLTKSPRAGRSFEVSASARPVHKSADDHIYWEVSKSGAKSVKKYKPVRRYLGTRWVYYKRSFKLAAGKYLIRAISPEDEVHDRTASNYLRVTVRR